MPSKPHTLDAEDRLQDALTAQQTNSLYYRLLKRLINGSHQLTAETLWKQAEESFSAWAAARVVVKQLQDAAKTSDLPDLPDSLQEDQEDDYISNITDDESSDEEAELIGGGWGQIHRPIEL